jgi:hypothetical protein
MENEVLFANAVSSKAIYEEGVSYEDAVAVARRGHILRDAYSERGASPFVGVFKPEREAKKLVGATEILPFEKDDLHHFLSPLERLVLRRDIKRNGNLMEGSPLGIFALVAEGGPDQEDILAELLKLAIAEADITDAARIYTDFAPIDPAKDVAVKYGFEPTHRQTRRFGIPFTLFVREQRAS